MKVVEDILAFKTSRPHVVTLGKFDGVHRGHRKLIRRVRELAREFGCGTSVFTFSVSPQVSLGERSNHMLMTVQERRDFVRGMDMDLLVECPFTEEIRTMEPEMFIAEILVRRLQMKAAVVGSDFRFGKDRKGTPELLRRCGESLGFSVEVLEKEREDDRDISSTFVREELQKGEMEKVSKLLGYPYFVTGEIVHGRHLGHSLGFPTINQVPEEAKMLPPFGVYVSRTEVAGKVYQGVSNIGKKPTVDGTFVGVETYLFDCSLDLYGQYAKVELLTFARPEQKFASVDELKAQMERDIDGADRYFGE